MNHEFFVSCPVGLESTLLKELKVLNIGRKLTEKRGGVSFVGQFRDSLNAILLSRVASRVFHKFTGFTFGIERDLYEKAKEKAWDQCFDSWQTFKINTLFDHEAKLKFPNSHFLSLKLKDAMADFFGDKYKRRPYVELENPDVSIMLRVEKKPDSRKFFGQVYFDLCGPSLSNRGYREEGHKAPIRENLAAGILQMMDYNDEQGLFDPMCGTGTFLVEAIYKKFDIAPCLKRLEKFIEEDEKPWNFLKYKPFKAEIPPDRSHRILKAIYLQNLQKLKELPKKTLFFGMDKNDQTIKQTRKTLRKLKLYGVCQIDLADSLAVDYTGITAKTLVVNPPYGERMIEKDINDLHYQLGEKLKNGFKNKKAYILTKKDISKEIKLKESRKIKVKNGNIDCRLLEYNLY